MFVRTRVSTGGAVHSLRVASLACWRTHNSLKLSQNVLHDYPALLDLAERAEYELVESEQSRL